MEVLLYFIIFSNGALSIKHFSNEHISQRQHTIIADDPPLEKYTHFIGRVIADNMTYAAVVVSGLAVATDRMVRDAEIISFCHATDDDCVSVVGVQTIPSQPNIVLVKTLMAPRYSQVLKPRLYNGRIESNSSCVAVAYDHGPVNVTIIKRNETSCSDCQHLDGIFCDTKIVGVLVGNKESFLYAILEYPILLWIANVTIGDDNEAESFEPTLDSRSIKIAISFLLYAVNVYHWFAGL